MLQVNSTCSPERTSAGKRLDLIGWMLFVIWCAVVLLARHLPDGIGPLGIGIIVLCVAIARRLFGVSISSFWLLIGFIFILAGIGTLVGIDLPFFAMALISCGILMLTHGSARRH